jgi:hypothetical protein
VLASAKGFWLLFGGIWLAVGLIFLGVGVAVGVTRANLDERFAASGRAADGVVLGKEIATSSSNSAASYRVTFRFTDENGNTFRGSAEVEPDAWDAFAENQSIELRYLPDRPQTYRVRGQIDSDGVITWVFGGVGALLTLVGGALVYTALRNRARVRELERSGVLTTGTVVDVTPGNLRINGVVQWKLRYRFRDAHGHTRDGSITLPPHEAEAWSAGATGRVRYDGVNPRSNVWIGQ